MKDNFHYQIDNKTPIFPYRNESPLQENRTTHHTNISPPIISVCIANYNGASFIRDCIESVLHQCGDTPLEIIVHDDASSDDSVSIIERNFPLVKIVRSDVNVGYCASNNRMADISEGQFLLFLNNDATLFPDAIRTFVEHVKTHQKQGILGLPQYDMTSGRLIDRGSLFDPFLNPFPHITASDTTGMVTGACLWIPKELWNEIGGFPEQFYMLSEDLFLCLSAFVRGYDVKILPVSGFYHWVGRSIGGGKVRKSHLSTTYKRRFYSERNKTFSMFICYPTPLLCLIFPIHIIVLVLEGIILTFLKRSRDIWRRIYSPLLIDLFNNMDRLLQLRRDLQNQKAVSLFKFFKIFRIVPYKLKMLLIYGMPSLK